MKERKVLVIDDEEAIRSLLCDFLETKGYRSSSAADAREMIVEMNKEVPDIVFLDFRLPDVDGLELLKWIKQLNQEIVVIMMSGYATEDIARDSLQWGAFDYLRKPFEFDQLERVLAAVEMAGF